jgi:hypothetical protein
MYGYNHLYLFIIRHNGGFLMSLWLVWGEIVDYSNFNRSSG